MAVRTCGGLVSFGRDRGARRISFLFGISVEYRSFRVRRSRNGRYSTVGVREGLYLLKARSTLARIGRVHVQKSIESRSRNSVAVFPGRTDRTESVDFRSCR